MEKKKKNTKEKEKESTIMKIRNESINETNVRMRQQTNLHGFLTDHKSGVALSRNRANGLLRGRVCTSPSWAKKTGETNGYNTDRSVLSLPIET